MPHKLAELSRPVLLHQQQQHDRWSLHLDAVPQAGFWPESSNYVQENCQTLHVHLSWKNADVQGIRAA